MPRPDPATIPGVPLAIDDHGAAIYTVGQVASFLGVQPAFVRRLDTEDVVHPARSAGGQRRYSRDEVVRVDAVRRMADEGMTLPGIKRILALEAEVASLHSQIAELERQLASDHDGSR